MIGWAVTDGEGTISFVSDFILAPGMPCTISNRLASFISAFGRSPSIALDDSGTSGIVSIAGTFRLADGGDSLTIVSPTGSVADFVVYGNCTERSSDWQGDPVPAPSGGEVAKRIRLESGLVDAGRATDWIPFRQFRYGFTEHGPAEFTVPAGGITAFTSPDCSLGVVLDTIRSSKYVVRLCTYELSSASVTSALLTSIGRGVKVRLLVEGVPAGGMADDEVACLSVLSRSGANVQMLVGNTSRDIVRHVGTLHAKYLVADDSTAIILSENFVESGLPSDRLFGNRGWGVRVSSEEVAARLATVFDEDSRPTRRDVAAWSSDPRFNGSAVLKEIERSNHDRGMTSPFTTSQIAKVSLLPSPDVSAISPFLAPILARSSIIDIEQFQVDLSWEPRTSGGHEQNPLLDALALASSRGASIRMLMDSSWFNAERNGVVVASLGSNISFAKETCSFKLLDPRSPITVLHNKGGILDSRFTLISSNNWVHASFAKNREMAAIVDSAEIASYFSSAFLLDWVPDMTPPIANPGPDIQVEVGVTVILSSNRSSDDRAIVSIEWDLDGDGKSEANGTTVEFCPSLTGQHRIALTVRDAWGNKGTAYLNVTVVSSRPPSDGGPGDRVSALMWLLPVLVGIVAFALRSLAVRRRPPRKLNH